MSDNRDDADKAPEADAANPNTDGSGDLTETKAKKVGGAPVVPTGKAGRGSVMERRVRTDADEPEDTRGKRANPVQYVGQVVAELRKVIWPTRMQMVTYTAVVFIFLVFMTLLVAGVDYGGGKAVEWTFGR